MFITALGVVFSLFIMGNGLLLIAWPRQFLRFYDFWSPGDYVARTAHWRDKIESFEYRLLGLGALGVGILIMWNVLRITHTTR